MTQTHPDRLPSDPDKILGQLRAVACSADEDYACDVAVELAALVGALDRALRRGARLPADWAHAERRQGERRAPGSAAAELAAPHR